MMNIDFFEPQDVPQPRANIRIERLDAKPYPDGWRVKLSIDVTPFQERPNLEARVLAADGREVAELSIIETMHKNMEFTVHIRGVPSPVGEYALEVDLYYEDRNAPQDQQRLAFAVPPSKLSAPQPDLTPFDHPDTEPDETEPDDTEPDNTEHEDTEQHAPDEQ
jgi:hypothetical protein